MNKLTDHAVIVRIRSRARERAKSSLVENPSRFRVQPRQQPIRQFQILRYRAILPLDRTWRFSEHHRRVHRRQTNIVRVGARCPLEYGYRARLHPRIRQPPSRRRRRDKPGKGGERHRIVDPVRIHGTHQEIDGLALRVPVRVRYEDVAASEIRLRPPRPQAEQSLPRPGVFPPPRIVVVAVGRQSNRSQEESSYFFLAPLPLPLFVVVVVGRNDDGGYRSRR